MIIIFGGWLLKRVAVKEMWRKKRRESPRAGEGVGRRAGGFR